MKRLLLTVIFFSFFNFFFAQTFYWAGKSGKISDVNCWKNAEGKPVSVLPGPGDIVVFPASDFSYVVDIDRPVHFTSWISEDNARYQVIGSAGSALRLNGDFILSSFITWNHTGEIEIFGNGLKKNVINTGTKPILSSVKLQNGTFSIVQVNSQKKLECNGANIELKNSSVFVKDFYADASSSLIMKDAIVHASQSLKIQTGKVKNENSMIVVPESAKDKVFLSPPIPSGTFKFSAGNNIMACTITTAMTLPSCPNLCDGTISFTLDNQCSGAPYTISYPGWPVSCSPVPTITSVGAGPVSFTLNNLCKCSSSYVVAILDNASNVVGVYQFAMVMSDIDFLPLTINTPSCVGQCNGSFNGIVTGGTGPYNVTLQPVGTTSSTAGGLNYNNLCAGIYTLQIKDNNGCSYSETLNLPAPTPVQPNMTFTNITCNGACNGVFNISPSGGTPGYTINFSTGSTVAVGAGGSASLTGLCPGTYSALVNDSKGCTVTANANLTQPPAITITVNSASATCNGTCNGSATVTASGGVSPFSYSWIPSGSTASVVSGLCQGIHTVQVTDNNNCVMTKTLNILAPPAITLTTGQKNITCNAQCNGSLGVSGSGGTGVISYTWTGPSFGPSNSSTITNLCPGVYTLVAKDQNSCTLTQTFNLTQPPPLSISATAFSINCFGTCSGSAIVNVSGGNGAPFGYTWSPNPPLGQGTATVSNLCAGNYTVSVLDASACPISTVVNIAQATSITPNVTSGSLACNGVCTGSINSTPSGGSAPYSFSLVTPFGSTLTSNPPYTGLCAGIYTLVILDAAGCIKQQTVNIQQPNLLTASYSASSVTCFGLCNGVLTGNANGGTPPYTFTWTSGSSSVASSFSNNVCAGSYTLLVKDANGCLASTVATVNQPTDINATLNITPPTCNNGCNGQITALVNGGTPSYTFNWSNGATTAINPNLCPGNYTLTVTDANGCQKTFTASVNSPPPMTIQVTTSSVACTGQCNGSATVNVIGGTPPFSFQFNTTPPTGNTSGTVGGLCAGGYIVQVTDAQNCSQNQNFSIGSPPPLTISPSNVLPSCNACTGAGTVNVGGGTPGYTVAWTNSLNVQVGSGTTASGLCPGPHTITVTDSKNCTALTTVTIGFAVTVTIQVIGSETVSCFGSCNGTAVAIATGGNPPYTYTWTTFPPQSSSLVTNFCAGPFTVTVQDQSGCTNTAQVVFSQPPPLTVGISYTNLTCYGVCNGAAQANAGGGTPAYSYTWLPGNQNTSIISGLCAGSYTVNVKDSNGCSTSTNVTVTQPSSISVSISSVNPTACNINNGQLCASPSGGSPGYNYTWTPAGSGGGNNPCNTGLGAGSYSLIVQDAAGCTFTTSASLSAPSGPTLTVFNTNSVSCFGQNNGFASVSASGSGPFTFTWSPSTSSSVVGATTTATGLNAGSYNLSATDANGCITSTQVVITQPSSITVFSSISNVKCFSACDGSIVTMVTGGTPGYVLNWTPAPGGGQGTQTVTGLCAGNYTLQITDANNCNTFSVFTINQPPALTAVVNSTNASCNGTCNGALSANAFGGTPVYSYSWLPVGSFPGSGFQNISSLCPNSYTLMVTDANNCTYTTAVTITQPSSITVNIQTSSLTCAGNCNGSATVTASGGTPTYSFSWSSSTVTTSTIGGLCQGSYTSIVTDQNGCQAVTPFTLQAPSAVQVTLNPFNPVCNGVCNGSITTNVSGGQGSYSYSWVPIPLNSPSITNLCAGGYTVIVSDANNCTVSAGVNLTDPPAINPNISFTNPLCGGLCNGAALANPSNVTPPVSYTWSTVPPANTQGVSNLCPGNYTLTIMDANGCTDVSTISISSPPALNIIAAVAPASCTLANGAITVVPSGGTPAYGYTWNPPALGNNSVVTGLSAGIYTVTVNDQNGCTNTLSIPVSNANGPSSATVVSQNALCNGACSGSANVTGVSGGTPPYVISWQSPPAPSTNNPIVGLCAGNYIVQIADANNCLLFQNVTISQPPAIQDNGIIQNPLCSGVCNGSIQSNPSGGTAPYNYSWNTGATTSVITNVCPGTYTLVITDANSCTVASVYNVSGTQSITSTAATTSNNCFNQCVAGSTITSIGGGQPPYSISWSNSQTGPVASNLCTGTYTAFIFDNIGCQKQHTIQVQSPPAIQANASVSSPSCGLCNGSGTISASGGVGGFTYTWSSGPTGTVASSLCAGIYNVLIQDANGCTKTETILISNSNGITGENVQTQSVTCFGLCNGAATVTPIGGTPPYTYSWVAPPSTNNVVTGLCAGNYFMQITDAQQCIRTVSVSVGTASQIVISTTIVPPSCALNNGSVFASASGGSGTFTYTWLPGPVNSSSLTNISMGVYTLQVSDGSCTQSTLITVNGSNAPALTFTQQNILCSSACTGSIIVQPVGGTSPYSYMWSDGSTNNFIQNLCAGTVQVQVIDNAGCLASQVFTLTSNPPIIFSSPNIQPVGCNNQCNGAIQVIPSGGQLPYTYSWTPTSTVTPPNPNTGLCAGNYTVVVQDQAGCQATQTFQLINPPAITLAVNTTSSTCNSVADANITTTVNGGVPSYTLVWVGPSGTLTGQNLSNILSGNYTLSLTDQNGCQINSVVPVGTQLNVLAQAGNDTTYCYNTSSLVLNGNQSQNAVSYVWLSLPSQQTLANQSTVSVLPSSGTNTYVLIAVASNTNCYDMDTVIVNLLPLPDVDAGPTYSIPLYGSVTIGGNPTSGSATSFTWFPATGLSNINISNPVASNTVSTVYTVVVTGTNGCVAMDSVLVYVYPEIKIPNGFSPNGDGVNDTWIIDNLEQFPDNEVEIYNRWGELLFRSEGYKTPFDGKYKGKDLPVGTYYYVLKLNHPAYPEPYTGPLTIFR